MKYHSKRIGLLLLLETNRWLLLVLYYYFCIVIRGGNTNLSSSEAFLSPLSPWRSVSFSFPQESWNEHSTSNSRTMPLPIPRIRTERTGVSLPTTTTRVYMCQLLGMNCATPTDFIFSLKGFVKRGGETDIHKDGWGLAFYNKDSNGIRLFHDDLPSSQSPLASFLTDYPIRTCNMISHIRYATVGNVDLCNVHPFHREMWGIQWCFAHNGQVPMFENTSTSTTTTTTTSSSTSTNNDTSTTTSTTTVKKINKKNNAQLLLLGDLLQYYQSCCNNDDDEERIMDMIDDHIYYHPVGTTDSEAAFCAMLNALRFKFKKTMPSLPILYEEIQKLANEIVAYDPKNTIFNFLLTCGPHVLWVYSYPGKRPNSKIWNGLYYIVRQAPFPTSCHLSDLDYSVDFQALTDPVQDRVSVIATYPLTKNEKWIELKKGELLLFDEGVPLQSPKELFQVELNGHGLIHSSKVLRPPKLEEDIRRYEGNETFFSAYGI